MKLPLSDRLLACCSFVNPGDRVADVGCDHGYLSIYLLANQIASSVIASDINEKPLQSAVINAAKYHISDRIRFYLSDGVRSIPRDFDTMVCAGMGADVMISILENAPWLRSDQYRLILQCQSKTPSLRKYLSTNGWLIRQEQIVRDGRFLYTVMEIVWQPTTALSPGECYISPALQASGSPDLHAYYLWVKDHLELAVNAQGEKAPFEMTAALSELKEMNL